MAIILLINERVLAEYTGIIAFTCGLFGPTISILLYSERIYMIHKVIVNNVRLSVSISELLIAPVCPQTTL